MRGVDIPLPAPSTLPRRSRIVRKGTILIGETSLPSSGIVYSVPLRAGGFWNTYGGTSWYVWSGEVRLYGALKESKLPEFLEKLDACGGNKLA